MYDIKANHDIAFVHLVILHYRAGIAFVEGGIITIDKN